MTGTNSPNYYNKLHLPIVFGCVLRVRKNGFVVCVHYAVFDTPHSCLCVVNGYMNRLLLVGCVVWLVVSVAYSGRETPGPIPNPEAKPASR